MHRFVLGAVIVMLAAIPAAARAPDDAPLVFWRFDPARFGDADGAVRARAAAEAGLRIASAGGLISDDDTMQLLHALLAASAVGGAAHTLTIDDLRLERNEAGEARLEGVAAVLQIETARQHADLVRNIQTILVDAAPDGEGRPAQRALDLPGGRRGVAFMRAGWGEAREVSWCSDDESFTVGLGRGALEAWFGEEAGTDAALRAHRAAVRDRRRAGRFFEVYVNIDALRHALEPLYEEDRLTPMLAALHLANGRDVMLHGTWVDADGAAAPLLAFDATWSVRSEPPGRVHRLRSSHEAWPERLVLPPPPSPPARYAIIAEIEPRPLLERALDLYGASMSAERQARFERVRRQWGRQHAAAFRRATDSLEPLVVLSDHPRPVVAVPGATTVFVPLKPGVSRERFERDVGQVLAGFADLVVWDERERAWSLYLEEQHIVRVATWGLAEMTRDGRPRLVLVGGFDLTLGEGAPSALLRLNRAWLAGDPE